MKNNSVSHPSAWTSLLILAFCALSSGCVESSSGMPYSSLPKPKTEAFTLWQPLENSAAPTSPTDQQTASDKTASQQTPADGSTAKQSSGEQSPAEQPATVDQTAADNPKATVQQTSGQDSDSTGSIAPAVARSSETPASSDVVTPDMTAAERMNLLMNNPDLEESTEVLEIKLLIPQKRFRKEDGGKVVRVSYDDIDLLKILNMQPVPADAADHFPDWLSELDGQRIRIRGFMIPPFQAKGLKRFALARDNGICCFVRTPKIYDVIDVRMAEGQTTHYIANTPFDVEGIFRIQPVADDGELYKLYKIEDATVIE